VERTVAAIVESIVRHCDPEEVYLFGSHAKGLAQVDSDLDFLVVSRFPSVETVRHLLSAELASRFPVRTDVVLVTPDDLVAGRADPYSFMGSVVASGVRLYRRELAPQAPVE
jgi:predicted nucleotidyltransferase